MAGRVAVSSDRVACVFRREVWRLSDLSKDWVTRNVTFVIVPIELCVLDATLQLIISFVVFLRSSTHQVRVTLLISYSSMSSIHGRSSN